jgi:hypothetical protein
MKWVPKYLKKIHPGQRVTVRKFLILPKKLHRANSLEQEWRWLCFAEITYVVRRRWYDDRWYIDNDEEVTVFPVDEWEPLEWAS